MLEPNEYFQIHVLHVSKQQSKIIGNKNEYLIVYPPDDFKPYMSYISEKHKRNCVTIIGELLHQSDKHISTFTDFLYQSLESVKTIPIETHIFIFHRTKGDNGEYSFVPKKDLL